MSAAASLPPVPHADVDGIPDPVARLRDRFQTGEKRPLEWRLEQLKKLESMLRDNEAALTRALTADLRKPAIEGFLMDIGVVASEITMMRKKLRSWMKPQRAATPLSMQPSKSFSMREPLGVVLIIAPWNYPVQLAMAPLAAGNVAVVKPSEMTPHTSATLARLLAATFAPDVVACVEGGAHETTALLDGRFDPIFYTGNGRVGRVVMQEEIFGPILPVEDVDEAIRLGNQREKPLALDIFTNRQEVEDAVFARTSAGGVGGSGMGVYHGRHGFATFSHHKSVLKKSPRVDPKLAYPPYTKLEKPLIKRFA